MVFVTDSSPFLEGSEGEDADFLVENKSERTQDESSSIWLAEISGVGSSRLSRLTMAFPTMSSLVAGHENDRIVEIAGHKIAARITEKLASEHRLKTNSKLYQKSAPLLRRIESIKLQEEVQRHVREFAIKRSMEVEPSRKPELLTTMDFFCYLVKGNERIAVVSAVGKRGQRPATLLGLLQQLAAARRNESDDITGGLVVVRESDLKNKFDREIPTGVTEWVSGWFVLVV